MKAAAWVLAFLSVPVWAAIPLSSRGGEYAGTGRWAGRNGLKGPLSVKCRIDVNRAPSGEVDSISVASSYRIVGMPMGDAYVIRNERGGFFELFGKNGRARGTGYCFGTQCHIQMPSDALEESIFLEADGCMSRMGSKRELGSLWNWSERLCPVKS